MSRVLIVDDDDDSRAVMRLLLETDSHEVHEAADGVSAVAMADTLKPDVALIDVGLPRLDGYEVAERIRRLAGPSIRLVAVTGYGGEEDRARASAAGFDLYLLKPADPDTVRAVVRRS
jgi:CheY-like chemotaxis protein